MQLIPQKKTVDSVMAVFTKTITELEKLGEQHVLEAQRQNDIAKKAAAAKEAAGEEASRAFKLRDKLANLINAE
jgi:hypothetical protein